MRITVGHSKEVIIASPRQTGITTRERSAMKIDERLRGTWQTSSSTGQPSEQRTHIIDALRESHRVERERKDNWTLLPEMLEPVLEN